MKKKVAYSFLIGDLFHYGHLKMLEIAKENVDHHICGVISDDIVSKWISPHICNYQERQGVIANIKYVDETICQDSMDPTENLKLIHQKYPGAEIYLVQSHHLWENILGLDFLKSIGGKVIQHPFYSNLSRENIAKAFLKSTGASENVHRLPVFADELMYNFFSTKADTLTRLRPLLSSARIEKEYVFTVNEWKQNKTGIISSIKRIFGSEKIIVRSSSKNEDSHVSSNAGHFKSIMDISSQDVHMIESSIDEVIESYKNASVVYEFDQVLVQKQTEDIAISGVVFTRNLLSNTPYYLINFDDNSGKTDTVTGGTASKKVEILKDIPSHLIHPQWRDLIITVREIEQTFRGVTLDIEFAIQGNGEIVIFQVRPLAANSKFSSIDDAEIKNYISFLKKQYKAVCKADQSENIPLSDMAFWNPAELIGDRPNYLDYSVFHHLITSEKWNSALVSLGYTEVDAALLVLMGNKPYINFRHAAMSLLPASLDEVLRSKLYSSYLNRLERHPELHDKVEFEIIHNCYRFDIDKSLSELDARITTAERKQLRSALLDLTNDILDNWEQTIGTDNNSIETLASKYNLLEAQANGNKDWQERLHIVKLLIEDCRELGVPQFVRAARFAFIGSTLMKSLVTTGVITQVDYDNFFSSVHSVASEFEEAFEDLKSHKIQLENFLDKFGHLRPGTYDITKLPYRKEQSYFKFDNNGDQTDHHVTQKPDVSQLEIKITSLLTGLCREHGLHINGAGLLRYIKTAIEKRELYKFIYTRNISLAIEIIAQVGSEFGFEREDLSHLDYFSIVNHSACPKNEVISMWRSLIYGRKAEMRIASLVSLPPLIFNDGDFLFVSTFTTKPNFITDKMVQAEIVCLDKVDFQKTNLRDTIVVLEKADPGYDWIFTQGIRGLITKYGGAASHMAIRCAEFELPAVIGCGDIVFRKMMVAKKVILDCQKKTVRVIA